MMRQIIAVLLFSLVIACSKSPELITIPFPNLDKLEPSGQQQLQQAYDTIKGIKDLPLAQQASRYGKLGFLFQSYDYDQAALVCYQNAHTLDPQDYRWSYLLGLLSYRNNNDSSNNKDKALKYLQALISKLEANHPQKIALYYHLAGIYKADQQLKLAQQMIEAALAIDPKNILLLVRLAEIQFASKQAEKALKTLEEASRIDKKSPLVFYHIAMIYQKLGNHEMARAYMKTLPTIKPSIAIHDPLIEHIKNLAITPSKLQQHGDQAYKRGNITQAQQLYQQAIEAGSQNYITYNNLANILLKQQQTDLAYQYLQTAIKLKPDFARGYLALAYIHKRKREIEPAIDYLHQAKQYDAKDPDIRYDLGELLFFNQQYELALSEFEFLVKNYPKIIEAWISKARTLQQLKRHSQGIKTLEEAIILFPDEPKLKQILTRYKRSVDFEK